MAVRHVLLALPAVYFCLSKNPAFFQSRSKSYALLAISATLGLVLAVSDWLQANVYRPLPAEIRSRLGAESNIWFTGHWGWQWYAKQQGMIQYEPGISRLSKGDFLLDPIAVDRQPVADLDQRRLIEVETKVIRAGLLSRVRTVTDSSLTGIYFSTVRGLPWAVTSSPLEQIKVFQVR